LFSIFVILRPIHLVQGCYHVYSSREALGRVVVMTRDIFATPVVRITAFVLLTFTACGPGPGAVYIGAPDYTFGKEAIELAVEEINDSGGIGGAELHVIFASAPRWQTRVHEAVTIADELSSDPRILAAIGHNTSLDSLSAAHIYNLKKVVQVVPSSSNPLITDIGPWIFRLCAGDDMQGAVLADVASSKLGFKNVAILFSNDDYGKMLALSFMENFRKAGGNIGYTGFRALEDNETLDRMVDQVIKSKIQQILFIDIQSGLTRMLQRFERAGYSADILASDTVFGVQRAQDVIDNLGKCRVFASTFYNPLSDSPQAVLFRETFKRKYGREAEPNDALFYDGVKIIAQAIENSGTDRLAVRNYLAGIGGKTPAYKGVSGTISFSGPEGKTRAITIMTYGSKLSVFEVRTAPQPTWKR
jgi:branched-chain amino acid transport system substrate-binding protein